jgi:predicted Zn-dependent protease
LALRGRIFPEWSIEGATSWFAATGLGLLLLEREPRAALEAFELALASRPDHVPALLGRAEALIALQRAQDALAILAVLLENAELRAHADAWVLAARAARQLAAPDVPIFLARAEQALAAGGTLQPWRVAQLQALRTNAEPRPARKKSRARR